MIETSIPFTIRGGPSSWYVFCDNKKYKLILSSSLDSNTTTPSEINHTTQKVSVA